jgi:hypothetical protein
MLSGEGVMQSAPNNRNEALLAQTKFHSEFGDHETLLNIFSAYSASKNKKVGLIFLSTEQFAFLNELK